MAKFVNETIATLSAVGGFALWAWTVWSTPQGITSQGGTDQGGTIQAIAGIESLACPQHLPQGEPIKEGSSGSLVVRDIYCLSNNPETKFADWVAYRLNAAIVGQGAEVEQDRVWKADPELPPGETLEPEDYTGAYGALKVDRGHLAPLASFRGANWEQVNYLSNIIPQDSSLNRGAWLEVERLERSLAAKGDVWVIVGTAYEKEMGTLPKADEPHRIPSAVWKVITAQDREIQAWLFEQGQDYDGAGGGVISLERLEERSGWDFPQNGYR